MKNIASQKALVLALTTLTMGACTSDPDPDPGTPNTTPSASQTVTPTVTAEPATETPDGTATPTATATDSETATPTDSSPTDEPTVGEETPTAGEETPTAGESTPTAGENTPTGGEETPTAGENTPTGGEETPTAGGDTPTAGEGTPTAGEETPTGGEDTPTVEPPTPGETTPTPVVDTPTPGGETPTDAPTVEPTAEPTATPVVDTPTATAEPTATPVVETPTATPTLADTPTATTEPTPTATAEPTPTATAEPTPTATAEPTPTATAEPTPTATAEPTPTATAEPTPTATLEPTPTTEPTPTATPDTPTVEPTEPPTEPEFIPTDIYDIKQGNFAEGDKVRITGAIVTAKSNFAFYITTNPESPEYNGPEFASLYVYNDSDLDLPAPGVEITVYGQVNDYFGQTQVEATDFSFGGNILPIPDPVVVDPADISAGGELAEEFEASLIRVNDVLVTNDDPEGSNGESLYNEYTVTGNLYVDDELYETDPFPMTGQGIPSITGVLRYVWNRNKLLPRDAADVNLGPAQLLAFGPENVEIYAGSTGPTAPALNLRLTNYPEAPLFVPIVSADEDIAKVVNGGVTIAADAYSAVVEVEGVNAGGPVALTADPEGVALQAHVSVLEIPVTETPLMLAEILYDVSSDDNGYEWVKLYNAGQEDINLEGWSLGHGGGDYTYGRYDLSGTVPAQGCMIFGGPSSDARNGNPDFSEGSGNVAQDFDPDMQNSGSRADAVGLFQLPASSITAQSIPVDVVVFGGSVNSGDTFPGPDGEEITTPHVGDASANSSIRRVSVDEWEINDSPNDVACPVILLGAPD